MFELVLDKASANLPALDSALRAGLGDAVQGVSLACGQVRVHLSRSPGADEEAQAREIVFKHDPLHLTADQRDERNRHDRLAALDAEVRGFDLTAPLSAAAMEKAVRWLVLRAAGRERS